MKLPLTELYIPDRDSRVMDEVEFRIPRLGFRIPGTGFRIPKAKKCWIPDSRFPYMGRGECFRYSSFRQRRNLANAGFDISARPVA